MTERKFYKTTYVFEVLSEEPIEDADLKDVLDECTAGCLSGDVKSQECVEVDGKTVAALLNDQRSDPGFFNIDDEGNDADD